MMLIGGGVSLCMLLPVFCKKRKKYAADCHPSKEKHHGQDEVKMCTISKLWMFS